MKDRKMPPKTLRTRQVKTNDYNGKGEYYKDYPIYFNKPQMDLLAATEKNGMTPAILNTWMPVKTDDLGYLCDEKARGDYKAVGEYLWSEKRGRYMEFKDVSHSSSAYGLTRDTLFTRQHQAAAVELICKIKLKPIDAISQISHVTGAEALLIAKFFDVGLNNLVLVVNRDSQVYQSSKSENVGRDYYIVALEFLIRTQKLALENAMDELRYLSPSQMKVLVDFYADGLRGDDVRHDDVIETCKKYADTTTKKGDHQAVAIEYFQRSFRDAVRHGKTPAEALLAGGAQLPKDIDYGYGWQGTRNKKFALKYFDRGIRESDLSPEFAEPQARRAFASLRILAKLSVADAVEELRGLDADKMTFLSKHYRHGVRNMHLVDIKHHTNDIEFLMKTFELTPLQALEAARVLTAHQMGYLHAFAGHGLTIDEAKSLQLNGDINRDRLDVALFLVKEKGYDLVMAIQNVAEKSGKELVDLMKHDSIRMTSIRL